MKRHPFPARTKHIAASFHLIAFLFVTITTLVVPAESQVFEDREFRGKDVLCGRSGLFSSVMYCGLEPQYEQIFVGSVVSYTETSETEARLVLHPEEIFKGQPQGDVEASIVQLGCLDEIHTGDRWLFYLQRQQQSPKLILFYASGSGPVTQEQPAIDLLRSLVRMKHEGVILGTVQRLDESNSISNYVNLANHKIIAIQKETQKKYLTTTDADGNFQFVKLPTGTYHLQAVPIPGLFSEEENLTLTQQSCFRTSFTFKIDSEISGHLSAADGSPVTNAQVIVTPESNEYRNYQSSFTDADGNYFFHGLAPGHYLIGLHIEPQSNQSQSGPALYYPGVAIKRQAAVIDLGQAEKRTGIDFVLPSASPKE